MLILLRSVWKKNVEIHEPRVCGKARACPAWLPQGGARRTRVLRSPFGLSPTVSVFSGRRWWCSFCVCWTYLLDCPGPFSTDCRSRAVHSPPGSNTRWPHRRGASRARPRAAALLCAHGRERRPGHAVRPPRCARTRGAVSFRVCGGSVYILGLSGSVRNSVAF